MNQDAILKQAAAVAEQMNGHPQPPPGIQPTPVPMTFRIGQGNGPGGQMMVVLMVSTPVGEAVYFLDGKMAEHVANGLNQAAKASQAGLLVPGA